MLYSGIYFFLTFFFQQASATTLAILDFSGSQHSKLYTDRFRSGILSTETDLKIISRENILLFEMEMLNCSLENCEVEIAQQLGTDYLISGYIQKMPSTSHPPKKILSISLVSTQKGSLIDSQQIVLEENTTLDDIYTLGKSITQKHFTSPIDYYNPTTNLVSSSKDTTRIIDSGGHFGIRRANGYRPFVVLSQSIEVDMYESGRANHHSAEEIIRELNLKSQHQNLQQCYTIHSNHIEFLGIHCNGWRLPTDMEWEYLACAGEDFPYSGSGNASSVANYLGNASGYQVNGQHKANAFGLYDMSGNLWEMTWRDGERYSDNLLLLGGSYHTSSLLREQDDMSIYSIREDVGYRLVRSVD
jgi:hypothetical protein